MATLYALYEQVRAPMLATWMAANERPYFYCGPGKGADACLWRLAAAMEAAAAVDAAALATIIDLRKCFDWVGHGPLEQEASATGLPAEMLRLVPDMHRAPRKVVCVGAAALGFVMATRG